MLLFPRRRKSSNRSMNGWPRAWAAEGVEVKIGLAIANFLTTSPTNIWIFGKKSAKNRHLRPLCSRRSFCRPSSQDTVAWPSKLRVSLVTGESPIVLLSVTRQIPKWLQIGRQTLRRLEEPPSRQSRFEHYLSVSQPLLVKKYKTP